MPKLSPVHYRILACVLACVFEKDGFALVREEGDHLIYTKRGILRPIVIPKYKSIPVFIIKNNLRSGGITRDRYFELFQQCQ